MSCGLTKWVQAVLSIHLPNVTVPSFCPFMLLQGTLLIEHMVTNILVTPKSDILAKYKQLLDIPHE